MPACVTALRQVHELDGYPAVWPQDAAAWLTPPKLIEACVAEVDGLVVGQVGIGDSRIPTAVQDRLPSTALVSAIRLYVAPASRRNGVGYQLLGAAVTMAEARGMKAVLDVEIGGTAAIALFERAGWTRAHTGPGSWITPDGRRARLHHYLSP
ncbi:GNAT family N-acetyltransferase [Nocardia abscessus]|uniref:GNAT family N-acetyltransferase n=2 Tax=Nocardia abscessus TaxID=120957 RepID=A0ABS0CDT8_9NOCA|nr:GNAT family N-acetyltransferase [Nocardia abscessus]